MLPLFTNGGLSTRGTAFFLARALLCLALCLTWASPGQTKPRKPTPTPAEAPIPDQDWTLLRFTHTEQSLAGTSTAAWSVWYSPTLIAVQGDGIRFWYTPQTLAGRWIDERNRQSFSIDQDLLVRFDGVRHLYYFVDHVKTREKSRPRVLAELFEPAGMSLKVADLNCQNTQATASFDTAEGLVRYTITLWVTGEAPVLLDYQAHQCDLTQEMFPWTKEQAKLLRKKKLGVPRWRVVVNNPLQPSTTERRLVGMVRGSRPPAGFFKVPEDYAVFPSGSEALQALEEQAVRSGKADKGLLVD